MSRHTDGKCDTISSLCTLIDEPLRRCRHCWLKRYISATNRRPYWDCWARLDPEVCSPSCENACLLMFGMVLKNKAGTIPFVCELVDRELCSNWFRNCHSFKYIRSQRSTSFKPNVSELDPSAGQAPELEPRGEDIVYRNLTSSSKSTSTKLAS